MPSNVDLDEKYRQLSVVNSCNVKSCSGKFTLGPGDKILINSPSSNKILKSLDLDNTAEWPQTLIDELAKGVVQEIRGKRGSSPLLKVTFYQDYHDLYELLKERYVDEDEWPRCMKEIMPQLAPWELTLSDREEVIKASDVFEKISIRNYHDQDLNAEFQVVGQRFCRFIVRGNLQVSLIDNGIRYTPLGEHRQEYANHCDIGQCSGGYNMLKDKQLLCKERCQWFHTRCLDAIPTSIRLPSGRKNIAARLRTLPVERGFGQESLADLEEEEDDDDENTIPKMDQSWRCVGTYRCWKVANELFNKDETANFNKTWHTRPINGRHVVSGWARHSEEVEAEYAEDFTKWVIQIDPENFQDYQCPKGHNFRTPFYL